MCFSFLQSNNKIYLCNAARDIMQNTDGLAIARSDELIELVTEIFGPWMNFAEAPAPSSQSMYVCMAISLCMYTLYTV